MPIYTRTGDNGETGIFSGQRVSKTSPVIELLGELDELNALLGMCVVALEAESSDFTTECEILEEIQSDLFIVGAVSAGANVEFEAAKEVLNIEKTIDDYEKILPKLKNFILPGGSFSASQIHYARAVVRKIERRALLIKSKSLGEFMPYLNRLSDLLFVMARYVNYKLKTPEKIWKTK